MSGVIDNHGVVRHPKRCLVYCGDEVCNCDAGDYRRTTMARLAASYSPTPKEEPMPENEEEQDLHPLAQRTIDRLERVKANATGLDVKFIGDAIKQIRQQNTMIERLRQKCERLDRERLESMAGGNIFGGKKA